jgi:hydrogenase expression/formation protein HypD
MDAEERFAVAAVRAVESPACRSGEVMQGRLRPDECEAFGARCTPERPLGAPMVSSEGACAAYWKYGRRPAAPLIQVGTR